MLALGSVKSVLTDSVKNGRAHFDMHGFLTGVVLADLNLAGRPRPCSGRAGRALCAGLFNVCDASQRGFLGVSVSVLTR